MSANQNLKFKLKPKALGIGSLKPGTLGFLRSGLTFISQKSPLKDASGMNVDPFGLIGRFSYSVDGAEPI